MTCIVGITDGTTVHIGADSAGVAGGHITRRADEKVISSGEFVMGFSTSFRMGNILAYAFDPPPIPDEIDLHEYMCTLFIDALRTSLKDGGYARIDNNVESGGLFLVGVRGRLFMVASDFQVGEALDSFAAIGCGDEFALGSLYTSGEDAADSRMRTALAAAAYFSTGVCGPFVTKSVGPGATA